MFDQDFYSVLPAHSGAIEKAMEYSGAWVARNYNPADLYDPQTCPVEALPWLAQATGVDLWYDDWSEDRKRRVIAAMPALLPLKGTVSGVEGYLDLLDVRMTYVRAFPDDACYSGGLTEEQLDAWLELLPQVRSYPFLEPTNPAQGDGFWSEDLLFDPDGSNGSVYALDDGRKFTGEKLFLYRPTGGVEMTIITSFAEIGPLGELITEVQAAEPQDGSAPAIDEASIGEVLMDPSIGPLVSIRYMDGSYERRPVPYSDQIIGVPYQQVYEASEVDEGEGFYGGGFLFHSDDAGGSIWGLDDAGGHIYRRTYLQDPTVEIPDVEGGVLFDDYIWDFPDFTAIIGVDVSEPVGENDTDFAFGDLIEGGHFDAPPFTRLSRAVEAVKRAKNETDIVQVDPVSFTPIKAGDGFTAGDGIKAGQMIERYKL